MTDTVADLPVAAPTRRGVLRRMGAWYVANPWRSALMAGYLTLLWLEIRRAGIPYDRERLAIWFAVPMLVLAAGTPGKSAVRLVRDWGMFVLLFIGYDLTRGASDNLWGGRYAVTPPIAVDKALFFGRVPNVWLQQRLYDPRTVAWWEAIVALCYLSHFFAVYAITAVLWIKNRDTWARWTISLVTTTVLGLIGFALYPMAPPWMAAQRHGELPEIERIATRGTRLLHLDFAERLWDHGSRMVNTVAAMPSLHAGYSMLVTAFFIRRVRRPWAKVLLGLYPPLMAFTLVYGGEHYVIDILVGWLIALIGVWLGDVVRDRWLAHRAACAHAVANVPA